MAQKYPIKAWLLLLLLSLIWGSSFILIKKALIGLSPWEVGSLRIFFAFIVLFPFAIQKWKTVPKDKIKYLIVIGFVGTFLPAFLFSVAQTQVNSAITGVLNALVPISTVIVGSLFFGQSINRQTLIGVVVGFLGAIVLLLAGSRGNVSNINLYALLIVLATILYAINANVVKYKLAGLKPIVIASFSMVFIGILSIIHLVFFTEIISKIDSGEYFGFIGLIAILGIIGTACALIIFNKIVELTNPVFTTSVTYLIPLVAVFWGLVDGEVLNIYHALGILTILIGVYIANSSRGNKKS
jgi:drug/metabolite transporter (DMT)-like permease